MGQTAEKKCPNCGTPILRPQTYCGECGERLFQCPNCRTINLVSSDYCHSCGKNLRSTLAVSSLSTPTPTTQSAPIVQPVRPATAVTVRTVDTGQYRDTDDRVLKYLEAHQGGISIRRTSKDLDVSTDELIESLTRLQTKGLIQRDETTFVERMHNCQSCGKAIGADEPFCRYCGAKQILIEEVGIQPILDPRTMRVALTMLSRVVEAKDHPEYSEVDELTTTIGAVALGGEKPQDAQELSFQDELRLLTLVFEYARDKVIYKGESFGEHVRWPWETMKTGGDCDCKVVLLASMLASLALR